MVMSIIHVFHLITMGTADGYRYYVSLNFTICSAYVTILDYCNTSSIEPMGCPLYRIILSNAVCFQLSPTFHHRHVQGGIRSIWRTCDRHDISTRVPIYVESFSSQEQEAAQRSTPPVILPYIFHQNYVSI